MANNPIFSNPFKKVAYYIILIVTLHWTCVAPAQEMFSDYFGSINFDLSLEGTEMYHYSEIGKDADKEKVVVVDKKSISDKNETEDLSSKKVYVADLEEGIIGKAKNSVIDEPSDNIFTIQIDSLSGFNNAILTYDVYGVDAYSVSSSINGHYNTGGYIATQNKSWTKHSQNINVKSLRKGENYLRFTSLGNSKCSYKIKNIKIELTQETVNKVFEINVDHSIKGLGKYLYIKGNVKSRTQNIDGLRLLYANQLLDYNDGVFEGFVDDRYVNKNSELKLLNSRNKVLKTTLIKNWLVKNSDMIYGRSDFPKVKLLDQDLKEKIGKTIISFPFVENNK